MPQGSPLSPLLYIIYTSDLLDDPSPHTATEAYADDLTMSATGEDITRAQSNAQAETNRIARWAKRWRQKFNATKSEVMAFGWTPANVELTINETESRRQM